MIKQIAHQVATANPGTNADNVYQILLVQLAKQTTHLRLPPLPKQNNNNNNNG